MENNKITDILSEWKKQSGGIKVPEWEEIVGIGLYMDQVTALVNQYLSTTEVTPAMINNYVKLKIMPAPAKKKYSRMHIAYIIMICVLKSGMSMSSIKKIIPIGLEEERVKEIYQGLKRSAEKAFDYISKHIATLNQESPNDTLLQFALSAVLYAGLSEKLSSEN